MSSNEYGCNDMDCCSEDCKSSCGSGCSSSEKVNKQSFIENTHEANCINRVVAVVSGKGGVGKSLVTSMLAVMMRRAGYKIGVLDADITGPSIPKAFGVTQKAKSTQFGLLPQKTHNDIKIMSINLLLENEESPVIWRGPIIAGTVKQFWTDVIWEDVDYLFLDMPPGTGDVPLTVFQSIPLDGIIIVTSPQDLVSMVVKKAYNMAKTMDIPVLGIVENMSYVKCPDCNKEINLYGESKINQIAKELNIPVLGRLPIDPELASLCDKGEIEKFSGDYLNKAVSILEKDLEPEIKFKKGH
jgi:Mrp family chromosome partitioning ATPase